MHVYVWIHVRVCVHECAGICLSTQNYVLNACQQLSGPSELSLFKPLSCLFSSQSLSILDTASKMCPCLQLFHFPLEHLEMCSRVLQVHLSFSSLIVVRAPPPQGPSHIQPHLLDPGHKVDIQEVLGK